MAIVNTIPATTTTARETASKPMRKPGSTSSGPAMARTAEPEPKANSPPMSMAKKLRAVKPGDAVANPNANPTNGARDGAINTEATIKVKEGNPMEIANIPAESAVNKKKATLGKARCANSSNAASRSSKPINGSWERTRRFLVGITSDSFPEGGFWKIIALAYANIDANSLQDYSPAESERYGRCIIEIMAPTSPRNPASRLIGMLVIALPTFLTLVGIALFFFLRDEAQMRNLRDLLLILLALEFMVVGVALTLLMIQLARLSILIEQEVRPMVQTAQETLQQLSGTARFLDENLVEPIVKINGVLAGLQRAMDVFRIFRRSSN
jgi:hypothetical protein